MNGEFDLLICAFKILMVVLELSFVLPLTSKHINFSLRTGKNI